MLLAIGLITLLYLMAYDRRPAADYGLVVGRNWRWHALLGLLIGIAFYSSYLVLCVSTGVFELTTASVSPSRCGKAMLGIMSAIPVAVVQQIMFSGYLPSTARRQYSLPVAVLASSLLFGVCGGLGGLFSPAGAGLAIGMTIIGTLLCLSRTLLGNLTFPAGLLAGAIMVRRACSKLRLLEYQPSGDLSPWLAPYGDPRQGVVLWLALLTAIAATGVLLWRFGPRQLDQHQPAIDASFKRIMPFSNLLGLAPLDLWLTKLWQARFRIGPAYIPRMIVSLVVSTINTVLTLPERLLAPLLIKHEVPAPVFIVGVHRSGTTHLHNLLSLDSRYCAPRNYQVFNPHGFLTGWLTTLVLGPFLTWRRPMDAVQFSAFSPQEEDFALAAMTPHSPYWFGCFPRLFADHQDFIYPDRMTRRQRLGWSKQLVHFLRKVSWWSRKSPLLKSPYNTARVAALRALFPQAKFVHIVRHPHATYRSNMHLAEHGWAVFQLQDPDPENSFASHFLTNYRDQEQAFYDAAEALPATDVSEVRFEDLEADPIAEVRRLYAQLQLEFTPAFERRLERYLASISGYKKNRFQPLPLHTRDAIDTMMGGFTLRWGYDVDQDQDQDQDQRRAA